MAAKTSRHNVFISFHEKDIKYKKKFVQGMGNRIIDRSVNTGNIVDTRLKTATVRQKIRDEYIRDATVTIVLVGTHTWQRKHVDWEIGSSLRKTKNNSRCGLLGIILPNHPNYGKTNFNPHLIPPRLADNCTTKYDPYALIYHWPIPLMPAQIAKWIDSAYMRRYGKPPHNSRTQFAHNRTKRPHTQGWQQ